MPRTSPREGFRRYSPQLLPGPQRVLNFNSEGYDVELSTCDPLVPIRVKPGNQGRAVGTVVFKLSTFQSADKVGKGFHSLTGGG